MSPPRRASPPRPGRAAPRPAKSASTGSRPAPRKSGGGSAGRRPGRQTVSPTSARKFARRQWRRRLRRARPALLLMGVLLLAGFAAWTIWLSSFLDVRTVTVRGIPAGSPLTAADIRSAAGVERGRPLAGVDLEIVRDRLLQRVPALKTVEVDRSWPHEIVLEVSERTAVAVLRDGRAYRLVDATGVRFRTVERAQRGLPIVELAAGVESPRKTLRAAVAVVTGLPADLRTRVRLVSAGSPHAVRLSLREGAEVMWGTAEQSVRKARVLDVLLDQRYDGEVELYDVSVPAYPTVQV